MADVSLSIVHGAEGQNLSDFTVGTLSPNAGDIEIRINDADTNGNKITRLDILKALKAFERAFTSSDFVTSAQE